MTKIFYKNFWGEWRDDVHDFDVTRNRTSNVFYSTLFTPLVLVVISDFPFNIEVDNVFTICTYPTDSGEYVAQVFLGSDSYYRIESTDDIKAVFEFGEEVQSVVVPECNYKVFPKMEV